MRLLFATLVVALAVQASGGILGFDAAGTERQLALEAELDASVDAADLAFWMRGLAARPHHTGSEHGEMNVESLANWFTSWGYDTEITSYEILIPRPTERRLVLESPTRFVASLTERPMMSDPSSRFAGDMLPPYNSFSPDGDVRGNVVYVNYGRIEDYETLERHGVDVSGKIVIARYGATFRGMKPKIAALHGAIGCIIYSDPVDDGYYQGPVYPDGPHKNATGVQRGSIMDLPLHAGDVLTPGRPAIAGEPRLAREDAAAIAPIPTLPISYGDAEPILAAMKGPVAPREWRGALPVTYRLGGGEATVHLKVTFDWQMLTAKNVIARRTGSQFPDQWVIRGNHHDAWNHGARDPISGLIALLAEAKAIAAMPEPKRTIVYAAWDAEEHGLMGSTEWVEEHIETLRTNAVAYLNTDGNGRGFLGMGGSHALDKAFVQAADAVVDPQTGVSVLRRRQANICVNQGGEACGRAKSGLQFRALGSGSDYSPFFQHVGIPSINSSFRGEGHSGAYHTMHDTVMHFERDIDPGHDYGVALAQLNGRITLRLANATVLPFDLGAITTIVKKYLAEVKKLADDQRETTKRQNEHLAAGDFALVLDPSGSLMPPERRPAVPHFNFAPLDNAVMRLEQATDALELEANRDYAAIERINQLLYTAEAELMNPKGLPDRPWYRHQLYAPGTFEGYGAKTLPAIRESIEYRNYAQVPGAIEDLAAALDRLTMRVEEIRVLADD